MATKKTKPAAKAAAPANDEKAAKRAEAKKRRLEAIKNRPAGQRTNSKSVDVIELADGSKVMNYAYPVRKFGVILTSVVINAEGQAVSTSITTLPGFTAKSKKGHGSLKFGTPGIKGYDTEDAEDAETDEAETEEEED